MIFFSNIDTLIFIIQIPIYLLVFVFPSKPDKTPVFCVVDKSGDASTRPSADQQQQSTASTTGTAANGATTETSPPVSESSQGMFIFNNRFRVQNKNLCCKYN